MSSLRKQVFTEKVLKRLFPNVSSGQEKGTPQTPALDTPSKDSTPEAVQQKPVRGLTAGDIKIQPERRLYTVSLPPPGYIPCLPEPTSCADSENASSGGDTEEASREDPAVSTEAAEELLRLLESGRLPPADVLILDHMKTLLLLQDTERLTSALKMFPEHCMMPPDHARIISAFFNYWITQILPEKRSE
ncbi:glutamate-rich protein 1 isoform X3 [Rattus norvegicus]|uniref:glutamate-rich protein 1 isoform 4 n=1 Tax=Rattus norvegicus TaxID=10116 RepID=UPI001916E6E2|nr:glutamate-rich protein 1 isoform X3 [Rattus norvegicus]